MAKARIYQPTKNAMQSGRGKSAQWTLEFDPAERRQTDPMVGWVGSGDTLAQVSMKFETKEAAIAFADKKGLAYTVDEPKARKLVPNNYSDNFANSKIL